MQGKGIALLPGEVVVRGTFRNHKLHGKAFIMVGGQVMFICDTQNGKVTGEILRVQLDSDTGSYYAVNMRTLQLESELFLTSEGFEMREEYFMNYDFIRKQSEKIDSSGRSVRMLDFEDGGMYFGVVQEELPAGLGSFVYSDLKFHCSLYNDGLMNGLSRIHFGDGDVYDGEAFDGQMNGQGFFFDCQNNEWLWGHFEDDQCVESIEVGEGFPRQEIVAFRAGQHTSSQHFLNRDTDALELDIDILIEMANTDISHIKPTSELLHAKKSLTEHDSTPAEYFKRPVEQENSRHTVNSKKLSLSKISGNSSPDSQAALGGSKTQSKLNQDKVAETVGKWTKRRQKNVVVATSGKMINGSELPSTSSAPSNGAHFSHLAGGGSSSHTHGTIIATAGTSMMHEVEMVDNLTPPSKIKKRKPGEQERLKITPGNQIIQDAHVLKPRSHKHTHLESPFGDDISNMSSVRAGEDSREHRNISIQTEDKGEEAARESDQSMSYLKNIHSMIDELKQLVSDKMGPGREEKLVERIGERIGEKIGDKIITELPHQLPIPQPGVVFPHPHPGLQPDMYSEPYTRWGDRIDKELEEKRARDIEESLNKRFGKLEMVEVDEKTLGIEHLEPIKESLGEEEEARDEYQKDFVAALERGERIWRTESEPVESAIEPHKGMAKSEDQFFSQDEPGLMVQPLGVEPPISIASRNESRAGVNFHDEITEADEKEFYKGGQGWETTDRGYDIGNGLHTVETPKENLSMQYISQQRESEYGRGEFRPSPQFDRGQNNQSRTVGGSVETQGRLEQVMSFGPGLNPAPGFLKIPVPSTSEPDFQRDSNFMYSRKGAESVTSSVGQYPGRIEEVPARVQPWYFLNPYLYNVESEVDLTSLQVPSPGIN